MESQDLVTARGILDDDHKMLCYRQVLWASKILAQAAYERRLAANNDWEQPHGTPSGKTVSG